MDKVGLGNLIYDLRNKSGLTQKELANLLHVTDKAVSRWETGMSKPSLETLYEMSKIFEVPYDDLIRARITESNENDKVVEQILNEFEKKAKRTSSKYRRILAFTLLISVIIILIIVILNLKSRYIVYSIYAESEVISPINGTYIETQVKDIIYLGDIKLKNSVVGDVENATLDIYYKDDGEEYLLKNFTRLENVSFSLSQGYIELDSLTDHIDNLYIRVNITNPYGGVNKYETKLHLEKDFSNGELLSNRDFNTEKLKFEINVTDANEIRNILLDNGYVDTANILFKLYNEYSISYYKNRNIFEINHENNDLNYMYKIYLNNSLLEVNVYDNNFTVVENYTYNINRNEMNCITGKCNDYKKIIEIFEENVLYLLK